MTLMSAYNTDTQMTRDQIAQLDAPEQIGRFHRPIPFIEFIEEVDTQLDRCGLTITSEEHLIGHEGQRHFGLVEIAPKEGELITSDEWKLFLGLRGSHDQSVTRGIAIGRQVLVCSNLCFGGDLYTSNTKQTTNILKRLTGMIYEALVKIPEMAHLEEKRVERLHGFEMMPSWGDAALVEIHRRGGLSGAQLARSIAEWDKPTHEEFSANGHTAWRLEQAVTEAVKPSGEQRHGNLNKIQERTRTASRFIDEMMGF